MKKTRVISMFLATALLLSACGGSGSNTEVAETNDNAIFKEETDVYPLEEGDISQIAVVGNNLYVEQYIYNYETPQARTEEAMTTSMIATQDVVEEDVLVDETIDEEGIVEEVMPEVQSSIGIRKITGFAADGTIKSQFSKEQDQNTGYGNFTVDEQGNVYSIKYQYATYVGDDTTDKVYLECCGADGAPKWELHLNEKMAEGEYYYVNSIFCDEMGQLILDSGRGIEIYDNQGTPIKMIEKTNMNDCRMVKIRDNKYALISSDGSSAGIQTLDIQSGVM